MPDEIPGLGKVFGLKALMAYAKAQGLPASQRFWRREISEGRLRARRIGRCATMIVLEDFLEYVQTRETKKGKPPQ